MITQLGEGEPPADVVSSVDEHISAVGCAVMPGMTNAHTHLFQSFFRGLADDRPLLDGFVVHLACSGTHHARLRITRELDFENLLTGCTTVIDHQYVHPGAEGDLIDDAVCRAADELGIRLLLAHGWADRNYHEPLAEDAATAIQRAKAVFDQWDGHDGRIRVSSGL